MSWRGSPAPSWRWYLRLGINARNPENRPRTLERFQRCGQIRWPGQIVPVQVLSLVTWVIASVCPRSYAAACSYWLYDGEWQEIVSEMPRSQDKKGYLCLHAEANVQHGLKKEKDIGHWKSNLLIQVQFTTFRAIHTGYVSEGNSWQPVAVHLDVVVSLLDYMY